MILERSMLLILQILSVIVRAGDIRNMTHLISILCLDMVILFSVIGSTKLRYCLS